MATSEPLGDFFASAFASGEEQLLIADETEIRAAVRAAVRDAFQSLAPLDRVLICTLGPELQEGFYRDRVIQSLVDLGLTELANKTRSGQLLTVARLTSPELRSPLGLKESVQRISPRLIRRATAQALIRLYGRLSQDQRIIDWLEWPLWKAESNSLLDSLTGEPVAATTNDDAFEGDRQISATHGVETVGVTSDADDWDAGPDLGYRSVPPKSTGTIPVRFQSGGRARPRPLEFDE